MRLYSRSQNSAGERVRIALNLKGLDYEYVPVGSLQPGEFLRVNPQGLMPALEVGKYVIAQSAAILDYLEETHSASRLLPADPFLRAQARAFAQLITSDLHPINNSRVRKYLSARLHVAEPGVQAWYEYWTDLALTALETTLSARSRDWPFCFGDAPGWADLHLAPQMANARRFGCDLSSYPLLRAVDARCQALDAFRQAKPEAQPDFPRDRG